MPAPTPFPGERAPDSSSAFPHPLDRVIWGSLTTKHRSVALGDDVARRYPAAFAPFAATVDTSDTAFESVGRLLEPGEPVVFFTVDAFTPPAHLKVLQRNTIDQMIGPTSSDLTVQTPFVPLGAQDVDEMMALIALTKPGPFGARTRELGSYLGVRIDGRLAAMAGERMHLDGYTEISAVCSHPDFRGRGYPRDLIATLSRAIICRGEIPFLHVFSDNQSAITLYNKLGFVRRRTMRMTVLCRDA